MASKQQTLAGFRFNLRLLDSNEDFEYPLIIGETTVGRSLLTLANVHSSETSKKRSVSREQYKIEINKNGIFLKCLGLNGGFLYTPDGTRYPLTQGHIYQITVGDKFTLCGNYFPFRLTGTGPSGKPLTSTVIKSSRLIFSNIIAPESLVKVLRLPKSNQPTTNQTNGISQSQLGAGVGTTTTNQTNGHSENGKTVSTSVEKTLENENKPQDSLNMELDATKDNALKTESSSSTTSFKPIQPSPTTNENGAAAASNNGNSTNTNGHTNGNSTMPSTASHPLLSKPSGSINPMWNRPLTPPPVGEYEVGEVIEFDMLTRRYRIHFFKSRAVNWEEMDRVFFFQPKRLPIDSVQIDHSHAIGPESKKRKREPEPSRRSDRQKNKALSEWSSDSDASEDPDVVEAREKSMEPVQKFTRKLDPSLLSVRKTVVLYNDACMQHIVPSWHLEKPLRLKWVFRGVCDVENEYSEQLDIITEVRPATDELLKLVHKEQYLNRLVSSIPEGSKPQHVTQYSQDDPRLQETDFDTFMSQFSMQAALIAAGAVCTAVDMLVAGTYRNAFCAVRPPGHHCGGAGHTKSASSQGYCIINNVAIGAMYAKQHYNFQRIAIVDFDVHHGNGTEEILGGKSGFLFISIHVGDLYPNTGLDTQPRESNVVNVAMNNGDSSAEFQRAIHNRIIPALNAYQPDLIFLSAGFDAHKKDPTDAMKLEQTDYHYITEQVKAVAEKTAGGRIISVLEGGYNLDALRQSVKEHLYSLITK